MTDGSRIRTRRSRIVILDGSIRVDLSSSLSHPARVLRPPPRFPPDSNGALGPCCFTAACVTGDGHYAGLHRHGLGDRPPQERRARRWLAPHALHLSSIPRRSSAHRRESQPTPRPFPPRPDCSSPSRWWHDPQARSSPGFPTGARNTTPPQPRPPNPSAESPGCSV